MSQRLAVVVIDYSGSIALLADVHNLHDGALLQVGIESQLRVEIKSNEAPPDKPPPAATKSKPPVASKPQSTAAKATKGGARSGKSLDVPEVEAPQTETEKDPADPAVSIPGTCLIQTNLFYEFVVTMKCV